jgi:hypothetical protein
MTTLLFSIPGLSSTSSPGPYQLRKPSRGQSIGMSLMRLNFTVEVPMSIDAHATTDHEKIRQWIQQHGGAPAKVSDAAAGNRQPTEMLFVDFTGSGEGPPYLEHVSWDEWFALFDDNDLAFRLPDKDDSIAYQMVPRSASI